MNSSLNFFASLSFLEPVLSSQRQYEALRAFYANGLPASEAAKMFNFSPTYFKKLRYEFRQSLKEKNNLFFKSEKRGPKKRFTDSQVMLTVDDLRKERTI